MHQLLSKILFIAFTLTLLSFPAFAAKEETSEEVLPPADVTELKEAQAEIKILPEDLANEFREESQKEAALSYGARGGLSKRTYEIRQSLALEENLLDKVYDFRRLLIKAPSGLLIEPPIIDEAADSLIIDAMGQEAAVTDMIYNIDQPAKIVTAPRNWRTYLEREWGEVPPPPDVLLPQTFAERTNWRKWVQKGWDQGYKQAEEIFQTDLDRLVADFNGMIRYRILLSQNMVSKPYALHEDRGVTGGGKELRVGDRAVKITGQSELKAGAEQWQPADR